MARKTSPDGHKLSSKACPQKFSASLAQNSSSNGRQKAKERIGDGSQLTRNYYCSVAASQQLRELELDGLIHWEVYSEIPPKVEYSSTAFAETLKPIILPMHQLGIEKNTGL